MKTSYPLNLGYINVENFSNGKDYLLLSKYILDLNR
jgi:hypothetical protein